MIEEKGLPELFGSNVFNEETMKERLSAASYNAWKKCITNAQPLDLATANEIAQAMKQWAVEKGATHYTHWFQPMTGVTAENMTASYNLQKAARLLWTFPVRSL